MPITKNSVVAFAYTLTDDGGEVLDSADTQNPLAYLHGHGQLIAGMEKALAGREVGDQLSIVLPPEEAYGIYDENLAGAVPRSAFHGADAVEVGMQFQMEFPGGLKVVTVREVDGQHVTVDGNHPLAGETLHFDIEVVSIRPATKDEIEHRHAHGAGGAH
ncbi:MAG: peptidylprolyl isomerase [Caldilineaceae bacterium]|nr:peptidylprolyl isomerase [Caldilineaceae bacterium]